MNRLPSTRPWTAADRVQAVLAVFLAAAALALVLLPAEWIEETFGVEPDGGSGLLELLPVLVLVAAAAVFAVRVARSRRAAAGSGTIATD